MTIYDIAKEAGVSPSTVSRVINNKKGINEETRKRVQKVLSQYNYIRNETARGLSVQSTNTIGILLEDIRISHHTDAVYVIEQEMTRKGYTCITFNTGRTSQHREKCIKMLDQRRVDGAILIGSMFATKEMEKILKVHLTDIPIVIANGYLDLPNIYGVLIDEEQGITECMKYLSDRGYNRPAFVKNEDTPSTRSKLKGFLSGTAKLGIPKKEAIVVDANIPDSDPVLTVKCGKKVTEQLIKQYPEIDSIVYSVDLLAVGGIFALREMRISVPDKVGIIGIDNTLYGQICQPSLTTLDNRMVEMSKNASRILLDVLEGNQTSHKIMLFTNIVERESTR